MFNVSHPTFSHPAFSPRGFLFIGDPHVSSTRPGRRHDDYLESVLAKLGQAARIAHERQLVPVILGDLIHRDAENSISMLTRLARVLREFPCPPLDLEGNHGKAQSRLGVGDIEVLLAEAGVIGLITEPGAVRTYVFGEHRVTLYAVPFGVPVPADLAQYGPLEPADTRIVLTHHDLAFDSAYPGAQPLAEVRGAHLLVNGHMHKTAASVRCGMTMLHCPGNIEPLSVDCIDHVPSVWEWTPQTGEALLAHPLAHRRDCFDLTGQLVAAGDAREAVQQLAKSEFAELLSADAALDAARTDEAAILLEDLEAVLHEAAASEPTATLLRALAREVSDRAAAAATPT